MRNAAAFRPATPSLLIAAALVLLAGCATAPSAPDVATSAAPPVSDDDGASGLGLYLAAEAALDGGQSDAAAALFARASAVSPGQEALRERAFATGLLAGRIKEAARFTPLPGEGPPSAVALGRLVRAVDTLADGRAREAEALVSDGAVGAPYADAAALIAPWAIADTGDVKAALAAPAPPSTGSLIESFDGLNRARLLERLGRYGDAEARFSKLAAGRQEIMVQAYGEFLERRGRRADAVKVYDAALAVTPEADLSAARARAAAGRPAPPLPTPREAAAQALIGPAAAAIGSHQSDVGLIYVRLALRLDPQLSEAWLVVGDALTAAGDLQGAAAAYGSVPDDSPEAPAAWDRLAVARETAGDKAGALAFAERAAKRRPDDSDTQAIYAEVLRDNDRFADAIAVLDPLVAAHGDGRSGQRLYFLRGAAEERAGRWPAAEADLKKALSYKPDDPEILNYLGFAWADRGEHLHEALPMLEKALAAQPDAGAVIDSVGWAHFKLGDYRAAVRELEHAVALEPADPQINDHLGDAYWRVGRKLEAGYQWRRVLTLDPDAATRAGVEAKLRDGAAAPAADPTAT